MFVSWFFFLCYTLEGNSHLEIWLWIKNMLIHSAEHDCSLMRPYNNIGVMLTLFPSLQRQVCESCNPCVHLPFTVFRGPLYQFSHTAFQGVLCFCFHIHIIWLQKLLSFTKMTLQTENLHQTIAMDIYRDLTTSPKPSALHRVIWALDLGDKKIL